MNKILIELIAKYPNLYCQNSRDRVSEELVNHPDLALSFFQESALDLLRPTLRSGDQPGRPTGICYQLNFTYKAASYYDEYGVLGPYDVIIDAVCVHGNILIADQGRGEDPLLIACIDRVIPLIKKFIALGARADSPTCDGYTAFHALMRSRANNPIQQGSREAIEFLDVLEIIRPGLFFPSVRDNFGETALLCLLIEDHGVPEIVEKLLLLGVNASLTDNMGKDALWHAIYSLDPRSDYEIAGTKEIIRMLVCQGLNPTTHLPAYKHVTNLVRQEIVDELINLSEIEIYRELQEGRLFDNYERLSKGERIGRDSRYESIELDLIQLIKSGIPLNGPPIKFYRWLPPPLAVAISLEDENAINYLIERNVSVASIGIRSGIQLIVDALCLHPRMLPIVDERHDWKDLYGSTILHYIGRSKAANQLEGEEWESFMEMVKTLVKMLPDSISADLHGHTPAQAAVAIQNNRVAELLESLGMSP